MEESNNSSEKTVLELRTQLSRCQQKEEAKEQWPEDKRKLEAKLLASVAQWLVCIQ